MMTPMKEYNGHTVTLDDHFRFRVAGPHFPDNDRQIYQSYHEATEAIDRRLAQYASQSRERLSLPVYTENGKACIITGVHARNNTMLGVGDASSLYPQQPFILAAIEEMKKVEARRQELHKLLYRFSLRTRASGSEHGDMIANTKNKYDAARIAAEDYQRSLDIKDVEAVSDNVVTLPTTSK